MSGGFIRNGSKLCFFLREPAPFHRHSIHASGIVREAMILGNLQLRAYTKFPVGLGKVKEYVISRSPWSQFLSTSSSSSSGATSASASRSGFVGWYLGAIKGRPVLTKSITSAIIYMVSDLTAQALTLESAESFDLIRTLRMAGFGLIFVGPSLHYWYDFVSRVLPKRDVLSTMKKIFMGQLMYGPVINATFYSVNARLQGESGSDIVARLKRDLLPTLKNGLLYWPMCDFVTFKFIPVHLQPLMNNGFAYLWTIYLTYMASLQKVDAVDALAA